MSIQNKLEAQKRETFGKGAARKLRAAGRTPVVMYGHGSEPVHLSIETHPLSLIVRHANALVELDIEGKKQIALVKDVQKNPVRQELEHVDFLIVNEKETVDIEVPVVIEGTPASGTQSMQELNHLHVTVPATEIPEHIVVDVTGLAEGTQVLAKDVKLSKHMTLLTPAEEIVAHIVAPRAAGGPAAPAEEAEAASE